MRFWDSSAVIPLLIEQAVSPRADGWLGEDPETTIWTLTPVEITSALWRLVREGALDDERARGAEARGQQFVRASHVIMDVEGVKARAVRALRVHALRAADALQLGAALAWAQDQPAGRVLHTFDERLATAARREGFDLPV